MTISKYRAWAESLPYRYTKLILVAVFLSGTVVQAQGIVREDQLEKLRGELGDVSTRVNASLTKTAVSMEELNNLDKNEQTNVAFALLDSIEVETRIILDKVKLNSPFMDALDDARARVVTILRKHEREPQSPNRDARIARLTVALEDLETQYREIQAVEKSITRQLSDQALIRREIQLDGEVEAVEQFVANLSNLTAELLNMTDVLAQVSTATIDTSDAAPLAQD